MAKTQRFVPLTGANGEKVLWIDTTANPTALLNEAEGRLSSVRDLANVLSAVETPILSSSDFSVVCSVLHSMASDALRLYDAAFAACDARSPGP